MDSREVASAGSKGPMQLSVFDHIGAVSFRNFQHLAPSPFLLRPA